MDYSECKADFNKLLASNYDAIDHCINLFKETPDSADIYHDILNGECIKITNKKTEYYNKKHDPTPVISNFKNLLGEENPVYLKFIEYCDPSIREKCCNCVSVSLYILDPKRYDYLSRFIFTIEQSILNLATYLPDWIYRLYLDPSVFEAIAAVKTRADTEIEHKQKYIDLYSLYVRTMHNIASQPNCEIYLTSCSGYDADVTTAGKRRNSRFSGFVEDDVNINACREADGLVDAVDCYNLRVFENLPIATFAYHLGSSPGMNYYKVTDRGHKKFIFTFSAGVLASKFKIKHAIFDNTHRTVLSNKEKNNDNHFQAYDEQFLAELFCIFSDNTSHSDEIRYLFGILPINRNDNTDISGKYYLNIGVDILDAITNNAITAISANSFMTGTIVENISMSDEYKDDTFLSRMVKYYNTEVHEKEKYHLAVQFNALMVLYILYCPGFFEYIKYIKQGDRDSSKFIIYPNIIDVLNITTSEGLLIIDTPDHFDNTVLDFFVHISENARTNFPKIGGSKFSKTGGSKNTDKYFSKYLKYKLKYLNIKNKSF